MADDHCPSAEILKLHALGTLGVDESSSVDLHLSQCSVCSVTLAGFDAAEDTLVSQLGAKVATPQDDDAGQLRHALRNIKAYLNDPSKTVLESGPRQDAPPIPEALRDYKLLGRLGAGGMGDVYKALHVKLDKIVALKVLHSERIHDPSAVARFDREIRIAGKLEHPNIVRATDAGEAEGRHFLVMEYVEGFNLADVVRLLGQLPVADACEMIRQAAVGLDHVHHHGLVHRDIKPSNLILTRDTARSHASSASNSQSNGVVKILDLGLALLHEAARPGTGELTHSGMIVGTIDYMAPEQGNDTHHVDIRADVYSLGATLFKLLTAEAPFTGGGYDRPLKKLAAIAMEVAPDLTSRRHDVPPELAAIVAKMLTKSPDERFATPAEVATALAPFAIGSDLGAILDRATEGRRKATDNVEVRSIETNPSASANTTRAADRSLKHHPAASPVPASHLAAEGSGGQEASSWKDFRVRSAVAAALLLVAAGLVFIFQTDKGDIIIQSDDENVKVSVENLIGDSVAHSDEMNWNAGQKTFHLRTGRYIVKLRDVDAKTFEITDSDDGRSKEIKLTRSDKKVITIRKRESVSNESATGQMPPIALKEADPALPIALEPTTKEIQKPFVVQAADGKTRSEWNSFTEAILAFNNGNAESIEVRGDGPFRIPAVTVSGKVLHIRAAKGSRPEFQPADGITTEGPWIATGEAAVTIEGCDWTGFSGALFMGNADNIGNWSFRNCKFARCNPLPFYFGAQLHIENCAFSGISWLPRLGPNTSVEFKNNIVRGNVGFQIGLGNQNLMLTDNTFYLDSYLFVASFEKEAKTRVTFERNIVRSGPVLSVVNRTFAVDQLKSALEWNARDNVYEIGPDIAFRAAFGTFGFYFDRGDGQGVGEVFAADFDQWKKFWQSGSVEERSQAAHPRFEFDALRLSDAKTAVDRIRLVAPPEFQIDWDSLGPGVPYDFHLQQRIDKGQEKRDPPAKLGDQEPQLRPEPPETGPVVLIRNGALLRGYVSLQQAMNDSQAGDEIEIRTEAPLAGCTITTKTNTEQQGFTICGARGYRPLIAGEIQGNPEVSLRLENVHIAGGLFGELRDLTMQNCSIALSGREPRNSATIDVSIRADSPVSIVNCVLPNTASFHLTGTEPLVFKNSIVGHLVLAPLQSHTPTTVRLQNSVLWAPMDECAISVAGGAVELNVANSWIEAGMSIFKSKILNGRVAKWSGMKNFYRSCGELLSPHDSRPTESKEKDPVVLLPSITPIGWRLTDLSPGHAAGPNGKDLGADVSLIGVRDDVEKP